MTRTPLITLSFVVALAGTTTAQVFIPPTPPPPPEAPYVPPPPAPPPERRQPANNTRPQPSRPTRAPVPAVTYRSPARPIELAPGDPYDGPVLRYDEPMQVVATRFNPYFTEPVITKLTSVMLERRATLETAIVDNLKTVLDVRGGVIETLSIQDMQTYAQVAKALEALVIKQPISDAATSLNFLPPEANSLHQEIIRNYQQALQAEVAAEDANAVTDFFLNWVLRDGVREAENAYEDLLAEAATRMAEVLKGLDLPAEATAALSPISADRAALELDRPARVAAATKVELAMRNLSLEQRQAFLKNVIATRGDRKPLLPILRVDRPAAAELENSRIAPAQEPATP